MTLKVSHQFAAGDVRDKMARVFGDKITEKTNGEIKFRYYPAKSLYKPKEQWDAMRMGALDMAVGNVLGSNLFNSVIIAVDDLFYTQGPLLAHIDPGHLVSAFVAIMMTGVAVVGFLYRPHRIRHIIGWASVTLLALFLFNALMQYQ